MSDSLDLRIDWWVLIIDIIIEYVEKINNH